MKVVRLDDVVRFLDTTLDIKLFRDLWAMKGQAFAIAMVIAGGTATYILASSTLDSLKTTHSAAPAKRSKGVMVKDAAELVAALKAKGLL